MMLEHNIGGIIGGIACVARRSGRGLGRGRGRGKNKEERGLGRRRGRERGLGRRRRKHRLPEDYGFLNTASLIANPIKITNHTI